LAQVAVVILIVLISVSLAFLVVRHT